ncbi:MAG: 16S rRNA (uracil(1498)-N(3))-methyltransferase [Coriobacteriaceae bacterium]|nr:16S rRNA (uracil(1498)-N(3))-methyltransferase [Coriobacteriaceae bacterium]
MSRHRFFLTAAAADGHPLPLTERDLHHARDVLRLRAGDEIVVVEPGGLGFVVRLDEVGDEVRGEVMDELPRHEGPRVWLVQGVAKGERTDLAVRMAVEAGVSGVVPVLTERSIVRFDAEKRRERGDRWRRIALEAAKQSQRDIVPQVSDPILLGDIAEVLPDGCGVVVPWEEASGRGVREALRDLNAGTDTPVAVVIGPEGGLSFREVDRLEQEGAVTCTLGETILRTETAGLVACALVLYELGGLGGARRV